MRDAARGGGGGRDETEAEHNRRLASEKNSRTLKIVFVDNGYSVEEVGRGVVRVYQDIGLVDESPPPGAPETVVDHILRFKESVRGGG